jgi:hypothetical protein
MTLRPHPLALAAACALAHSPLRAQTAGGTAAPVQTVTITAPAPLGEKDHLPQAQAVDAATLARAGWAAATPPPCWTDNPA